MSMQKMGLGLVSASLLAVTTSLYAGEVGSMNTFTSGTTALAEEVNENFSEQTAQINDNDTRITANAEAIAASGLIKWESIAANCPSSADINGTFTKISNIGTYMKAGDDSVLNIVYSGRLRVATTTGTGVKFELRIDDTPTTSGRIRGVVKAAEVGGDGVAVTMEGFFSGLSAGSHTVSMWAQAGGGASATGVMYDPGCWSSDQVVIKEFGQ